MELPDNELEKAAVCGDFTMLENEVAPVMKALVCKHKHSGQHVYNATLFRIELQV